MAEQIHIVHIVESFGAGCLSALTTLIHNLPKDYKCTIIYSIREETPADVTQLFPASVRLIPLQMRPLKNPLRILHTCRELTRLLRELKPNIIHCHSSIAGGLGRICGRWLSIPTLYTPHAYAFLGQHLAWWKRQVLCFAELLLSRIGTATVACGDEEFTLARGITLGKRPVFLVHNGLNSQSLDQTLATAPPTGTITVGTCGRLTAQHGIQWFNEAAQQLKDEADWVWIGASLDTDAIPQFVRRTGWLTPPQAQHELARLDIMLHPTQWDGLSYSVLEAMYMGKTVIARDIPPSRALITDGVNGFLAATTEEMLDKLRRVVQDPALREAIGAAAHTHVSQNYSPTRMAQQYMGIYNKIVRKTHGAARQ